MASRKLRNQLAAQAWMAQTEAEWRQEQEKALQRDDDFHIKEPEWATQEYILQLAGQLKRFNDLREKEFRVTVGFASIYALQFLLIGYLIWKAVRP